MQTHAPWWEQATGWKIKQTRSIFWFFLKRLLYKKKKKRKTRRACAAQPNHNRSQALSEWRSQKSLHWPKESCPTDIISHATLMFCARWRTKGIFFFTHPRHLTPRMPLPSSQQTQQDPSNWTCRVLLSLFFVFLIEEFPTGVGCRESYFSPPQKVKRFVERAPAKLRKLHLWPGLQWRSQTRLLAS